MSGNREPACAPDAALDADLWHRRRSVIVEVRKRRVIRSSCSSKEPQLPELSVGELVQRCHALINASPPRSRLPERVKLEVLSTAMRLQNMSQYDKRHACDLESQFKAHQVRDSKRTDVYTRLVKLLFRNGDKRSEVNRLANTLRLAVAKTIDPNDLPEFVRRMGRIVECSNSYATRSKDKNTSNEGEMRSDVADCLRESEEITLDLGWAPDTPFSVVLVPKGESKFLLAGWRRISLRELQRIATSFHRNNAKADWRKPGYSVPEHFAEPPRETLHLRTRK